MEYTLIKKPKPKIYVFGIILFFIIVLVIIIYTNKKDTEFYEEFYVEQYSGTVKFKCNLDYEKNTYILIDSIWYGIGGYRLKEYIENGDLIIKNDSSLNLIVEKDNTKKVFRKPYIFKVNNKIIRRKLESKIKK